MIRPARRAALAIAVLGLLAVAPAAAQRDRLLEALRGLPGVPPRTGDARTAEGLKQALEIGAGNAMDLTGRVDGCLANQAR